MLTKTHGKILEVFVSKINKKFSINEIALLLGKPYALIYNSIQELIKLEFINSDDRKLLSINYFNNFAELAYIESGRTKERLKGEKSVSLFIKDCLKEINEDFFTFLIFGSFVEKKSFNDLDVLIILDNFDKIEKNEKIIKNIASDFSFKVDLQVISKESVQEMLSKKEQKNVINESLNKHLIVFGGENYYKILSNDRG
ncbi:MAG: nucleotidyltransferase domain-containing protein [Nanoarchaeota archaeon]